MKKLVSGILFSLFSAVCFAQDPTVAANNLTFTTMGQTSLTFTWTRGNGDYCLVAIRPSTSSVAFPVDGASYGASSFYGAGSNLGNNNFVVYKSTGTSVTVTGLTAYTAYYVTIFEWNVGGTWPYTLPSYYKTDSYETGYHYTLTTEPTGQVTGLTATSIQDDNATLSWTSGNGSYDFLTLRASTTNTNLPVDGNSYSSSSTFGSGSAIGSASPYSYVVYYSTGTAVTVANLTPSTNYVANACTYNGLSGGQNYYLTGYPTYSFTTLAAEPTGNSNWLYVTDIADTAFTINWMRPATGAGNYCLVTLKQGTTNTDLPVDRTIYSASSVFGSGSTIGGGAKVVYNGTGNTVRVTGLTKNTYYTAVVYEFSGSTGTFNNTTNYNTSSYVTQISSTCDKEPGTASSGLSLTAGTNSVSASWTSGTGNRRIVTVRPGRLKTALAFDGTNDYVDVPYHAALQPSSAVTVEAWVYKPNWTSISGCHSIAGNYNNSGGYGLFICSTTAYAYIKRNGAVANPGTSISYLTPGWHHFALTYDGRYTILWVDGAKKAENDAGATYNIDYAASNNFYIGAQSVSPVANYLSGAIDEVRVWSTARSSVNIRNNLNESMLGNETSLVGEWRLDDGYATATTALNNSLYSTALNGTLTNMTSTAASAFTGSSGWIKSGAPLDAPSDFTTHSASSVFTGGGVIDNGEYAVYNSTGNSVTVTNLTPGCYYNFSVYEFNNTTNNNYQVSTYLTGDVQTSAQPLPDITSFSPTSGNIGSTVTINGSNFDPTTTNNTVYFGATKATVLTASATQLTVLVPYCANYVPISVSVNTSKGVSRTPFVVTNSCGGTISAASFTSTTISTGGSTYSGNFAKDIDRDGKSDLLTTDVANTRFSVVRNNSANGILAWASQYNFTTNGSPQFITSDDIDGDEKPDVVVACGNSPATIDIFRNISSVGSVNFATRIQLATAASPGHMALVDLDRDGKLDLVVGHGTGGVLQVYRNTSSSGVISFAPPLSLSGLSDAYTVKTADLNGDDLIELVVGDRSANMLSIFPNNSTSGNISFGSLVNISPGSGVQAVGIGDFDNNGKPDLCAGLQNNTIRIYQNSNTGAAVISGNFSLAATLNTYTVSSATPYEILVNDLDGDGGNDIVCGYSLGGGTVSVFEKTTPTGFTFAARQDFTTSGLVSSYLTVDDLSLDGHSDFVMATYGTNYYVYNNNINALSSEPIGAATSMNITSISQTSFNVSFTAGGGANRIIIVKPSSAILVIPADGVNYSPNSDYSLATDIGAGNKVVYNGNSNSVSVTGLTSNTTYNVYVYEYNSSGACTYNYLIGSYLTNSATTLNFTPTLNSITSPSAICQNSGAQNISLTGIGTGGETQTLSLSAASSNTLLIPNGNISFTYTSPNPTATITYTPANGQSGTSVITVTVNDGASNNNTVQSTFTVTVAASPTTANAGSNVSICAGATTLAGNTPSVGTGVWSFVYTSNGSIVINNTSSPTSAISNFNIGDSVRLAWTISNSPCSASVSNVSIKRKNCPLTADFIADQTAACGSNVTINYTDLSVDGGNTIIDWSWSFPGGTPSTYTTSVAGNNPPPIVYATPGVYSASLTITPNSGSPDSEVKSNYITITALPGAATTISGPTTVCQGQTGVTYSVSPISAVTTYSWTVPAGASINGSANTNTISVDYSAGATAGNVSVTGSNSCGDGTTYNQAITVNNLPGTTGAISGPTSACQGATGVIFTVGAISGATTYTWTLPPGASVTNGANTNSITVSFSNSATDGIIDVQGVNSCGVGSSSSAYTFSIDSLPLSAGSITGNATVCPGDTVDYSIAAIPYATTYTWTLPSGGSIIAGAGTNSVTVAYSMAASSGNITARGTNSCGSGSLSSASITVNPLPSAASSILFNSGNTTICAGSSSTVSAFVSAITNATGYTWNLPAGFVLNSGANTNNILMSIDPTAVSGTITVNGTNSCGDGVASSVAVTVSPLPGIPGTITGSATVCQTQNGVVYTTPAISNATSYSWNVPLGATIVSGANTNTITVDYSATADTGFVTVMGTNACGNGLGVDSLSVIVNPLPDAAGSITGDVTITICPVQTGVTYSVSPVNHATGYTWAVPTGAVIASGANTNVITVNYSDTALTGNISVTPTNACGNGTASLLHVDVDTVMTQSICIVTVDSTSSKNFLIWEKPVTTSIDSFRIYRDITGVYTKIAAVDYAATSEFMDTTNGVNPNITQYRYKISAVDACGNESYLSDHHQTIHLQISAAIPCGYNLQWNDYIGINPVKYRIMRDTLNNGTYHAVDSVGPGIGTWTDITCWPPTDTISYYIEITNPNGTCVSSIKNPLQPMASNLNLSKSNINRTTSLVTTVPGIDDNFSVQVYPNPSTGAFILELQANLGEGMVKVYDVMGNQLQSLNLTGKEDKVRLDMSGYAKGVYQVEVKRGNYTVNKEVIIH